MPKSKLIRQLLILTLVFVGVLIVLLLLPSLLPDGVQGSVRDRVWELIGIFIAAAVALSSTTFVSNALAGLMLRAVDNFSPGDFVQVGDQFGRVTERGLFHIEIQTEDRDLSTLPNLYLISNPVTVVRADGTIVSATLSLGYDVNHIQVEALLCAAVEKAGLESPFVHIMELGDFSVVYRFSGFLPEVKQLLTVRSRLRTSALDTLHEAGIEIVSPSFMNQRPISPTGQVIPAQPVQSEPEPAPDEPTPEDIMFDKAERAGTVEAAREEQETINKAVADLHKQFTSADGEVARRLEKQIEEHEARLDELAEVLNATAEETV